jgi:hypothetical protein
VAELIALGMVKSVGMIESKMGYCAANPFIARNLSLFYFIYDEAATVKSPLLKGWRNESFNPGYYLDLDHKVCES